jgi:hypothetical protein
VCFFSDGGLSNAEPNSGKRQVQIHTQSGPCHLLNWGRDKEFSRIRRSRSKQGAHPDARYERVQPSDMGVTEQRRAEEGSCLTHVPEGQERCNSEGANVCKLMRITWQLEQTRHHIPTVLMESVFITAVVDIHEGCNITCFNILDAFLHADLDEDITMILEERHAKLMVQVAPNLYKKYITADRQGTAILYAKMQKAIYGLLRSALLFYMKLVADLESI